ncbi:hypothetical protein [Bacteroides sp.]|uniref:hypothetical protein n=1 Tax=Bacteroides sp. TaxID=29523 RepID=UPI002620101D|nr:hypothetical protein [Bacteroides sp.]MDD3041247.1 hypothetical protein [Bacteroides sp.]
MKDFHCPHCGAEFEIDDWAYLNETGLCQYCHGVVAETASNFWELWRGVTYES